MRNPFEPHIPFFIEEGKRWVEDERERCRPHANALPPPLRASFEPFFESDLLDRACFVRVPSIQNPPFYAALKARGIPEPLDFSQMAGITFRDTILISESRMPNPLAFMPLLFHELVHVAQYDVLGDRYTELYVRGWAENGFDYNRIPLEVMAYELQERFRSNPEHRYLVSDEVRRRFPGGQ